MLTRARQYGNKVLRWYLDHRLAVVPVHPTLSEIEGVRTVKSVSELEDAASVSVSFITPPAVTAKVAAEAFAAGVRNMWFQPNSAHAEVHELTKQGVNVLTDGACIIEDTHSVELPHAAKL